MNAQLKNLQQWYGNNAGVIQGAAAPMLVVAILAMMVLPLPPMLLDAFFTISVLVASIGDKGQAPAEATSAST